VLCAFCKTCSVLFFAVCFSGGFSLAQQPPLEESVSKELLKQPTIESAVERLRLLRANLAKLGARHPSRASVQSQIDSAEKQLSDLLQREAPVPPPKNPFPPAKLKEPARPAQEKQDPLVPETMLAVEDLEKTADPVPLLDDPNMTPSKGPHVERRRLPTQSRLSLDPLKIPRPELDTIYRLENAFPKLGLVGICRIGAFPNSQILWGVENDVTSGLSRIWKWKDHRHTEGKSIFWSGLGETEDVAIGKSIETHGEWYLVRRIGTPEKLRKRFEISRCSLNAVSDLGVIEHRMEVIATGECSAEAQVHLRLVDVDRLMVVADGAKLSNSSDAIYVAAIEPGVFLLSSMQPPDQASSRIGAVDRETGQAYPPTKVVVVSDRDVPIGLLANPDGKWTIRGIGETGISVALGSETVRYIHPVMASVYRGNECAILKDSVLVVDSGTGSLWSAPIDAGPGVEPIEVCRTSSYIVCSGSDSKQEPLIATPNGVWRLGIEAKDVEIPMPDRLSATGWFSRIVDQQLVDGFFPYDVGQPAVNHGVYQERWLGLPMAEGIDTTQSDRWQFPDSTIFLQTLYQPESTGTMERKPAETRVLIRNRGEWFPFVYRWKSDASDAILVKDGDPVASLIGSESPSMVRESGWGVRQRCDQCHRNRSSDYVLGFNANQLEAGTPNADGCGSQIGDLSALGFLGRGLGDQFRPSIISSARVDETMDWSWFEDSFVNDVCRYRLNTELTSNGLFPARISSKWTASSDGKSLLGAQGGNVALLANGFLLTGDEAYRVMAEKGANAMISVFEDRNYGGFMAAVDESGNLKGFGKSSEEMAFAIIGLTNAFIATNDRKFLETAVACWETLRTRMSDSHGGFASRAASDFTRLEGCSSRTLVRILDAVLGLCEITNSQMLLWDADQIVRFAKSKFLEKREGVALDYSSDWTQSKELDGSLTFDVLSQVEWAYMLSRATENGLSSEYRKLGSNLFHQVLEQCLDEDRGGLLETHIDDDGWMNTQAGFLRAAMHFADIDQSRRLWKIAIDAGARIRTDYVDAVTGGWPNRKTGAKGDDDHFGYEELGMYLEGIRLAEKYREQ
jgi:mannose/cellobiose epimerase-like protein (N-acyl-D-glucosamine 2-epimerase family)